MDPVHCEHCANKDKSKWQSQCLYKGSYPSHRAFVLSTFDPPCSEDAYNETRRESKKQNRRQFVQIALMHAAIFAGLVWWFW